MGLRSAGGILRVMARMHSHEDLGTIVVFGGRSEIGIALAKRLVEGRSVVLAARRSDDLVDEMAGMRAAGATDVTTLEFDADATDTHPALIDTIFNVHGPVGAAIVAFGILGDQRRAETDVAHALRIAQTDYVGQISVLTPLANALRSQGSGTMIVFSSIAGVRVRRGNYVYGSAKAGLDGFASGLADALHGSGVRLLLARPGFVIGNMTADLMAAGTKPAPMSVDAEQVADAVARAYHSGRWEVWIPGALRVVGFAMRFVPRAIWRRLPR
ncbi:putative oxidoreductase [Gordonia aichiensis NBRC 108223]|uniref:Putative oxidoreductase n=2 Tax=Gordonia aichiensis TaxID=36820 RepID=L7KIN9_9ACTN|nr:putative oxidoreductase [Gordonia aichiensis NBRC 108223]